ncbi:concanavalin A-like lectin/glucanase domain-containing protein [Thelonectria olida]|uniref:Concanavalin A-like lectin/glucanase domain-containing protein n=1 Tax=Thelonectria olida TaxID=1576542 RepID=A0A9P9ALA3_9HYPO|nr:concanavalin A-like lectin/glucanase domain-containing protein [Thelonectria olida]
MPKAQCGYSQCLQVPGSGNPPSPTTTSLAPTRLAPVASLCTQYAYYSTGAYSVLKPLWGIDTATTGSQCTYYYGQPAAASPSALIGAGSATRTRPKATYMPIVPSIWSYNVTNTRANVAYDIFTDWDINHDHSSGEYEIVIWQAFLAPSLEQGRC